MDGLPDWNTLIATYTEVKVQHPLDRRPDLWVCGYIPEGEILTHLLDSRPSRVLDYGCGNGRVSRYLRARYGHSMIGLDVNPEAIRRAQTFTDEVTYYLIAPNVIPYVPQFDACICNHVFPTYSTLGSIEATLTAITSALRPGAHLLIYVDNTNYTGVRYYSFMGGEPGHTYESGDRFPMTIYLDGRTVMEFEDFYWKPQDYIGVLRSAGFCEVSVNYPLPDKAGMRIYEEYFGVPVGTDLATEKAFPPAAIYCARKRT